MALSVILYVSRTKTDTKFGHVACAVSWTERLLRAYVFFAKSATMLITRLSFPSLGIICISYTNTWRQGYVLSVLNRYGTRGCPGRVFSLKWTTSLVSYNRHRVLECCLRCCFQRQSTCALWLLSCRKTLHLAVSLTASSASVISLTRTTKSTTCSCGAFFEYVVLAASKSFRKNLMLFGVCTKISTYALRVSVFSPWSRIIIHHEKYPPHLYVAVFAFKIISRGDI
jgi:hypothetical protein